MKKAGLWALLPTAGVLASGAVAAALYGKSRWAAETAMLRGRLEAARRPVQPATFDPRELEGLPAPVQRYFQAVLTEGQPMVAAATMVHQGIINMSASAEQWKPFTSTQRVVTQRPGFDWDARVAMMPGLPVHVHDAYVAGEGTLHAAVLGLVSVADIHGTRALARGELMRWFAEAVWYPTALLPSQGVHWEAVDDLAARATLTDGDITLTLDFHFQADGLVDTVLAQARERVVGGTVTTAPWQGRFSNYAVRDGMRVPLDGEVAWILSEGAKLYFRATITELVYEFAH